MLGLVRRLPELIPVPAGCDEGKPGNCAAVCEAAFSEELVATGTMPGLGMRADWLAEPDDAVASSGLPVVVRAWLFEVGVAYVLEYVVGVADAGLLARQAAQDSHPDNVIPVRTRPIKAIPGVLPIGFSFLHG